MKTLKTLSGQLLNLDVRLLMMLVMVALMVMPELAMAADTSPGNGTALPFADSMTRLSEALTGPFVTAISVVAIVGAGAMLIFGGDMNGFMRTLIFLVMVIALMITAGSLVKFIGEGAVVADVQHAAIQSQIAALR